MIIVRWDSRDHPVDLWSHDGPVERWEKTFSSDGTINSNDDYKFFFADKEHFTAAVPHDGRIVVPAVAATIHRSHPIYSMGCMEVDQMTGLTELLPGKDPWLEAFVRLAGRTYWPMLEGPEPPRPKIMFYLAGGSGDRKGFKRPDPYLLERAILELWAHWQSEDFRNYQIRKQFKLWGARHQSLIDKGFKEALSVARLKKAYYFLFPVPKMQKSSKNELPKGPSS